MNPRVAVKLISSFLFGLSASMANSAIIVTQTTDGTTLATALGGSGLVIDSVTVTNGAASQFGTYTNFNLTPVGPVPNGIVMSTGQVINTPAPASAGSSPSTNTSQPGTTEFNTYGAAHITNFTSSNDVARLQVNFTLPAASNVRFGFVFGSVEYPLFVNNFTDAFLVFLDGVGVANQIVFDANGNPVQVGTSFSSLLTTADLNTAFANPHALLPQLTTVSPLLAAGSHSLLFEVGDVNDHILDSAVFLNSFGVCTGTCQSGTGTGNGTLPEPPTLALLGIAFAGFLVGRRRKA